MLRRSVLIRRSWLGLALVCAVFTAVPFALACGAPTGTTYGERGARAAVDAGAGVDAAALACFDGLTCDPATPFGLAFGGALPAPHTLAPIALGGREAVRAFFVDGRSMPSVLAPGWAGPFDAVSVDPGVLSVRGVAEPDVDVTGRALGSGRIDLVQPTTRALFDRVSLEVRRVDRFALSTPAAQIASPDAGVAGIAVGALDRADARITFYAALLDENGEALWDDSLRVDARAMGVQDVLWSSFGGGPLAQTFALDASDAGHPVDLVVARDAGSLRVHLDLIDPSVEETWLVIGGHALFTDEVLGTIDYGDTLFVPDDAPYVQLCAALMTRRGAVAGAAVTLTADPSDSVIASVPPSECLNVIVGDDMPTLTARFERRMREVQLRTIPAGATVAAEAVRAAPSPFRYGERASSAF